MGYEFIVETILPIIEKFKIEVPDILRTFVEHIAIQIAEKTDAEMHQTILITGGATEQSSLEEAQQLADDFLFKPFDFQDLINKIESLLLV